MCENEFCINGPVVELIKFSEVAGVPIHYARPPVSSYGSRGVPREPKLDKEFYEKLTVCLEEIWRVCPGGIAGTLVSAGCYVAKAGMHGIGRAIDIDSIWWEDTNDYAPIVTMDYPRDRQRYLATEAIIRKHFGIVLNYHYNKAHRDHWHIDDSQPVGFFNTSSRVVFVQAALRYIFNIDIEHDGIWGQKTIDAVTSVTSQLATPDAITYTAGWTGFLDAVALCGYGAQELPTGSAGWGVASVVEEDNLIEGSMPDSSGN